MKRRCFDDDEAWADEHIGHAAMGSIVELTAKEVPGVPFQPKRFPLGFDINPDHYRRKRRRKK